MKSNLSGEDVREGLTAVVSVKYWNLNLKAKQKLNLAIAKLKVITDVIVSEGLKHSSKNILKMRRKSSKGNDGKAVLVGPLVKPAT